MTPTLDKTFWHRCKGQNTKSFMGREAQIGHFRRSDLSEDTIKRIIQRAKLARRRDLGWLRVQAWQDIKKQFTAAGKRHRWAQKQRRRCKKALQADIQVILEARQKVSRGTDAEKIACFRRIGRVHKKKPITFKLQSGAMTNSETVSNQRGAVSAPLPKSPVAVQMLQTTRSVNHSQPSTEHIARNKDGHQNPSHRRVSDASMVPISNFATASSSQPRQKASPSPSGPQAFVILIESLPAWAHWYEPPLSAAQVEHVRKRMKTPEEYLSMGSIQSDIVVAHDLSMALRSMCQTFNRSVKLRGIHAEKLKYEFLRPRGQPVDRKNDDLRPMEERTTGTVSIKEQPHLPGVKSRDTAGFNLEGQATISMANRPLRADMTCSASSILSKRIGKSQLHSHKRKKATARSSRQIHLGHRGDFLKDSKAVAYMPGRSKSGHLQKDPSGQPHSSKARNTSIAKFAITNKRETAVLPKSTPEGHKDAEKVVEKEKRVVKIPADCHMATDLRAYSQWPGR